MKISISTLFPHMFNGFLTQSIIGRAIKNKLIDIECLNIRDFTKDKHRRVDDYPYGGGSGMIIKAQPIYDCYNYYCSKEKCSPYVIYMSPRGRLLSQNICHELSKHSNIFIICGHYEGVDQRLVDAIVDDEISIGDYVVTGGELPSMILVDSIVRLLDGVLSSKDSLLEESHINGLLEYAQYTRPRIWNEMEVPDILLSGHKANIDKWKTNQSLQTTIKIRPDLIEKYQDI